MGMRETVPRAECWAQTGHRAGPLRWTGPESRRSALQPPSRGGLLFPGRGSAGSQARLAPSGVICSPLAASLG